ncbi:hypothetical protein [Paenibacillus cremeus]|uniref:DUF1453 domain-containing protein n=1 Tax=Paenibacillus cremeus TaxID=2163881 RepID=A0A559KFK9_9BACL|nr:hypothetical protein [Paenibacillus cremeus]TVY10906.1 hypothetical protein FPZ49_05340 [Paenibacillus cremeus]
MHQPQSLIYIVVGIFILYRVFLRVRRTIGWQQLNPGKMQAMAVIFSIVGLIFLVEGGVSPINLISDALGIAAGGALAYYGAMMTQLEQRGDGRWYYRPNVWIGSLVTVLFLGRLGYRFYTMYTMSQSGHSMAGGFNSFTGTASVSWTTGLMLIMFAYYVGYNLLLLRKKKHQPSSSVGIR